MNVGDKYEWFLELEAEGNDVPALKDMPVLYEDLVPFWRAFNELSRTRPVGMGVGAIPMSEILAWLDLHEIGGFEDRIEYARWIGYLDSLFLEYQSKKQQQESTGKAAISKRPTS